MAFGNVIGGDFGRAVEKGGKTKVNSIPLYINSNERIAKLLVVVIYFFRQEFLEIESHKKSRAI